MKLSVITINYNDAEGLRKTLDSAAAQCLPLEVSFSLEHIIIDGGSTDASVEVIQEYASTSKSHASVLWVSEPDKGVYNAMNKGILKATGDYIQILNAGDIFANGSVIARTYEAINRMVPLPEMLYGNMLVEENGKLFHRSKEVEDSLKLFYTGTMNHDCCWMSRSLFVPCPGQRQPCYGLYDENLKIVSDWKWFLQAIGLGHVRPVYVDIDMTIFDLQGISEKQLQRRNEERRQVLKQLLPPAVLADYDKHAFDMEQMDKLRQHTWAYKLVWTLERILNRLDNRNFRKPKTF